MSFITLFHDYLLAPDPARHRQDVRVLVPRPPLWHFGKRPVRLVSQMSPQSSDATSCWARHRTGDSRFPSAVQNSLGVYFGEDADRHSDKRGIFGPIKGLISGLPAGQTEVKRFRFREGFMTRFLCQLHGGKIANGLSFFDAFKTMRPYITGEANDPRDVARGTIDRNHYRNNRNHSPFYCSFMSNNSLHFGTATCLPSI